MNKGQSGEGGCTDDPIVKKKNLGSKHDKKGNNPTNSEKNKSEKKNMESTNSVSKKDGNTETNSSFINTRCVGNLLKMLQSEKEKFYEEPSTSPTTVTIFTDHKRRPKGEGKRHKVEQVFPCDVCKINCTSSLILEAHLKGKKHLKAVKRMECSTLPLGVSGEKIEIEKIAVLQEKLYEISKVQAVIGLEYIVEYQVEGDQSKHRYFCELCVFKSGSRDMLSHVVSFNHRLRFMRTHSFDTYTEITSFPKFDKVMKYSEANQLLKAKCDSIIHTKMGDIGFCKVRTYTGEDDMKIDSSKYNSKHVHPSQYSDLIRSEDLLQLEELKECEEDGFSNEVELENERNPKYRRRSKSREDDWRRSDPSSDRRESSNDMKHFSRKREYSRERSNVSYESQEKQRCFQKHRSDSNERMYDRHSSNRPRENGRIFDNEKNELMRDPHHSGELVDFSSKTRQQDSRSPLSMKEHSKPHYPRYKSYRIEENNSLKSAEKPIHHHNYTKSPSRERYPSEHRSRMEYPANQTRHHNISKQDRAAESHSTYSQNSLQDQSRPFSKSNHCHDTKNPTCNISSALAPVKQIILKKLEEQQGLIETAVEKLHNRSGGIPINMTREDLVNEDKLRRALVQVRLERARLLAEINADQHDNDEDQVNLSQTKGFKSDKQSTDSPECSHNILRKHRGASPEDLDRGMSRRCTSKSSHHYERSRDLLESRSQYYKESRDLPKSNKKSSKFREASPEHKRRDFASTYKVRPEKISLNGTNTLSKEVAIADYFMSGVNSAKKHGRAGSPGADHKTHADERRSITRDLGSSLSAEKVRYYKHNEDQRRLVFIDRASPSSGHSSTRSPDVDPSPVRHSNYKRDYRRKETSKERVVFWERGRASVTRRYSSEDDLEPAERYRFSGRRSPDKRYRRSRSPQYESRRKYETDYHSNSRESYRTSQSDYPGK